MKHLKEFFSKIVGIFTKKEHRKARRAVFSTVAAAILLCTVYALILPGITATATKYALQDSDIMTVVLSRQTNNGWVEIASSAESLEVGVNDMLRFEMEYELQIGTLSANCDTVVYQLPSCFSKVTANSIPILGSGGIVGNFSITENGLATIVFDSSIQNSMVERNSTLEVGGTIRFDCRAGDIIGDGDGQLITLGEWSIVLEDPTGGGGGTSTTSREEEPTEPPPPESDDLPVKKTHTVVDSANGIVDFTAVFRAEKATEEPPLIYDHMASGMVYVENTFQIREATVDEDDNVTAFGSAVAGTTTVGGKETLVPGETDFYFQCANNMTAGQVYAVTYRAKVIDPFSGSYHTNNQIKVTTVMDGKSTEGGYKDDVWLYNNNFVTKHADYNQDGSIAWTITVHRQASSSLDGWILSDIFEGYDYTGTATLKVDGGTGSTVTFPYTFSSGSTGTDYVFTYTTPYEPKIGQTGVDNIAVFRPHDYTGDNPIKITETFGMDKNNPLTKTDMDVSVDTSDPENPLTTILWSVEIEPTISKLIGTTGYNWLYDDTLNNGQYLTADQAAALDAAIEAQMTTKLGLVRGTPPANSNAAYNAAEQKDYTFECKRSTDADIPDGCFNRFTLHVYHDLAVGQTVEFTYSSTGPTGELDQVQRYQNRGKLMQNAPGDHVYSVESQPEAVYRPAIVKTDPIPPTDSNVVSSNPQTEHDYYDVEGKLEWELAVTVPRGITSALTVEDVLPEGVNFESLVLSINKKTQSTYEVDWDNDTTKTSGAVAVGTHGTATVTRDGQNISIVIPDTAASHYAGTSDVLYFRVVTALDEMPSYEDEDDAPHFENNAAVKVATDDPNVMRTLGSDKQTQVITVDKYHGVLSKSAIQSPYDSMAGLIPYHLEINPNGADLLDGTDTLILTDTLRAYSQNEGDITVTLDPSTMRVYQRDDTKPGSKGELLDASRYSYSYRGQWKDHNVQNTLTMNIPDACGLIIEYTYMINTRADRVTGKSISNTVKLEGITDGVVGADNTIVVDFESGVTAGVKGIIVYKVDSKNYGMVLPDAQFTLYKYNGTTYETVKTVTTNGDGMATLTDLTKGTAYKLVETRAPENYLLDPEPYYFIVSGGTTVAPSDFVGDLLMEGTSIYRPNTSNYTEINVVKQWQDANGSEVSHDGTVQFNLYRKIGTRDPNVTLTASITRRPANYADPVTIPFTPQTFQRGDTVEFVVTEDRYRPGQGRPDDVTFYVNGDPRVVEPYWDPAQNSSDHATVTYTLTFRIDEDTNIVGDIGILTDDRTATVSAKVSGTTLPPEESTSASTSAITYAVRFKQGGSGELVNGGDEVGDEDYFLPGTQIRLILPDDVPGKHYTGWKVVKSSSLTTDVTSSCLSGSILTMPSYSVNLIPLYEETEVTKYSVTVYGGLGRASVETAAEGTTVSIEANAPEPGTEFDRWLVVDGNGEPVSSSDIVFADINSATTTFTMPAHAVIVEPVYKAKIPHTITLTAPTGGTVSYSVQAATSDVAPTGEAYAGDTVTLSVPTIPNGKLFDKWVVTSPSTGVTLSNIKSADATFTMPDADVAISATFRDKPNNLIMNGDFENVDGVITSSTGGYVNVEGTVVSIDGGFEWTPYSGLDQIGSSWSVVDGVLVYNSTDATSNTNWVAKIDPTYNDGRLQPDTAYTLFADVNTNKDEHFYVAVKEGNKTIAQIPNEDGYVQFTTSNDPNVSYSILIRMVKNEREGVTFSVDNVILVEGTVTEPPSGNPKYNINLTQPASGGTISANKASEEAGKTVTLTATPATGYALDHWVVTEHESGDPITVTGNTFTMPEGEVDVTAVFSQGTYTITVVDGTIYGSSATTAQLHVGDTVEIQLDSSRIPEGKEFYRWDIYAPNSGVFINTGMAGDAHAEFRLDTANDVTLTATYQPIRHNIVFTDSCGTASKDNTQVTTAGMGDTVKLTPNPPTGKVLDSWTVINDATLQPITVASDGTFEMPNSSVTISATWKDAPVATGYTLTVNGTYIPKKDNPAQPITVLPSSTMTFEAGETATIVVTYPDAYNIKMENYQDCLVATVSDGTTLTPVITQSEIIDHNSHAIFTYTVTMDADKTVTLTSTQVDYKVPTAVISGGTGGGEEDGDYNVVVDSTIEHGTVTANPTSADEDDVITLTITPDEGYALGTLTVEDASGNPITVSNNTFTMPASDVNVTATFAPLVANAFEEIVDRVTLSFYDADCTQYGITYHSYQTLTNPVIQYVSGGAPASWTGASTVTPTLSATVTGGKMKSLYDPTTGDQAGNEVGATDYVYKGALPALSTGTYTYRVGGKLPNGEEVWSDPYTFTARAATADPNMSFIWFSDSHYNTLSNSGTALRKVLNAADSLLTGGPDMILSGGDFTDHGDLLYYAASAIDVNEDYFATTPFFVASGNHDRKGVSSTASHIVNVDVSDSGGAHSGTGDYYSFDYNGVHVVVLDNGDENHSNVNDNMVNWLKTDLANSNAEWKLVMMHKPIYGPVQSGSSESVPDARAQLAGVFAQYGVDVVLQGHVHMYGRSYPITDANGTEATGYTTTTATDNGFTYNVTVNPGAPIYTVMGIAGATGNRTVSTSVPSYLVERATGQPYSFSAWRIEDDMLYVDAGYTDSTGTIAGYYEHFAISKDGSYVPPTPTTYAVNISGSIANGEVTTDNATAAANATVTLTVEPDTGYELDELTVTKAGGGTVATTSIGNGQYTFTMPAEAVTVSATFTETGGDDPDPPTPVTNNLIVNGDFSNGTTGWTNGGVSFTVSNGVASFQNGQNSGDKNGLYQLVNFISGHSYTLTCDITLEEGSSNVKLSLDGNTTPKTDLTGHYSYTFTADGSMNQVRFTGDKRKFTIDNVVLIDNDAGGGGGDTTTYTVTAATGLTGGTIASVSPVTAAAGDTITVTLSPNTGYELDAWNITGGITPTATGNTNEYTFTMPANDVTVSASFKSSGSGTDPAGNLLDMTASAWSGSPSISGNKMTLSSSANVTAAQSFTTIPGHTYTVTGTVDNGSNGDLTFTLSGGGTGSQSYAKYGGGSLSLEFTATGTTTTLTIDKPAQYSANITDLQVLASPSNSNSPNFDDAPLLDSVAGNHAMLGDTSSGVLVEGSPFTITASNSWQLLIQNLPSTEIIEGQEVFYVYYVEEVTPASADFVRVAYDNNDGIATGEITIINTVSEEEREQIILPETGGGGNLPFVIGGTTLIAICLFGGVVMTRRRRRASG